MEYKKVFESDMCIVSTIESPSMNEFLSLNLIKNFCNVHLLYLVCQTALNSNHIFHQTFQIKRRRKEINARFHKIQQNLCILF